MLHKGEWEEISRGKKMEKKKIHQIYQKMRSCQLSQCITAHANRDSHSAGTKRNHFLPRCVIKQWSRPPSWPGQRGMEWFGKPVFHCGWDYCAFLHYMWKGETQEDRECNLESKMNYLSSCGGKHLSSAVIPPHGATLVRMQWKTCYSGSLSLVSNLSSPLQHMIVYWSQTTTQQSPRHSFVKLR